MTRAGNGAHAPASVTQADFDEALDRLRRDAPARSFAY
jgi:hypothetical protein